MIVSIPGGWPVCLWLAQWPDDHNIWKWGCHVRCLSWRSVVCRFPPVTETKGCPPPAASEATLPPLGALERWREGERERGKKTEYRWERDGEGRAQGINKMQRSPREKRRGESSSREGGKERGKQPSQ